jgi:hypothetical protein
VPTRAALRQLANRLIDILHGCLTTGTNDDERTALDTTTKKINKLLLDNLTYGMSDNAVQFEDVSPTMQRDNTAGLHTDCEVLAQLV